MTAKKESGLLKFIKKLVKTKAQKSVDKDIANLLRQIEHLTYKRFNDYGHIKKALTHKSSNTASEYENYERMEFLGDAVLGLIISDLLYTGYRHENEGKLTYYKDTLIQMRSLALKARKLGLAEYVKVGAREKRNGFANSDVLLADIFESLVGAIYIDMGFEPAYRFIKTVFEKDIKHIYARPEWDFKSKLNNIVQELYKEPPEYKTINETVVKGIKIYNVAVVINNEDMAHGEARNKKEAEQIAAMGTLKKLGKL
ncbi:MAG: ribonuclease III [Deltaproteobacteria bacterium]|nr:ribonuclease III [Deltaproteobacteria bacterium]MCL5792154.1 ribonuclease III [Deltaproteobacteria bacterium]